MQLWHLYKRDDTAGYFTWDCTFGFVVRAETEDAARALASSEAGDEGAAAWLDTKQTTCEELTAYGEAEIILRDFHAG